MPVDPRDPVIGRLIDRRYEVGDRIARGGMASVYEAVDRRLDRKVAVKVMHPHLGDDPDFRERFIQEARAAARLAHPNVVNTYDQGEDGDLAWLVMELVPSITLRDLLGERGRITPEQSLDVLEAVLAGLAAAHRAGIVHRDLKPENILLAHDGRIKIGDFGLARAAHANTATGKALLGTIAYLSPELVTRGVADTRSDIYAVGIMLFEMLTGAQPFTGDEPMQIAYQHANDDVPLPSSKAPGIPEALDSLVHWATQREPNLRPADAGEMLAELHAIRERGIDTPTTVLPSVSEDDRTTTIIERPSKRRAVIPEPEVVHDAGDGAATVALSRRVTVRRRRGVLWLGLVLLGALLAAGVGWWFNGGPGGVSTVPEVAGEPEAVAVELLAAQGIEVAERVTEPHYDVPAGAALRTDPPAGTEIGNRDAVQLVISSGRRSLPVPEVAGIPLEQARAAIEEAEFRVADDVDEVFDARDAGTVLEGFAPDGTALSELDELEERSPIRLRVSLGPVPAEAGQVATDARAALEEAGLRVDFSAEEHSSDVEQGRLISLAWPTDRYLRPGDTVTGVVSLGPRLVAVPDVVGLPIQEALDTIREAELEPDLQTNVPEALWSLTGANIVSQGTEAGTEVEVGSTVVLDATF
ncbi:Stk1 family PASTA domain-containing Ser/Thr kinase [Agrococcus carbonis]|uniref:non-specific serine/threonine protein kinase n=1 Tax=Agrococcus carbonis TaxID=684552 RepID=A0A1H1SWH8_9MICO|nr:Stk1 family PASTA domain-containing Ser/Thr kinase [Agrococcus carbonis]SDS52291.1 serine/threonine protein kinase [Agrococcus carbonis]